jgi:hypothetical protein
MMTGIGTPSSQSRIAGMSVSSKLVTQCKASSEALHLDSRRFGSCGDYVMRRLEGWWRMRADGATAAAFAGARVTHPMRITIC